MNLSFYIARRYLFSKKKHNAINIIAGISVCGVTLATLALVCTMSIFNGFQELVTDFFTAFDPELKITAKQGKFFSTEEERIKQIKSLPEIAVWSETLEEQAMVQYKRNQTIATIKGVTDNFQELTQIDSLLYGTGSFMLHDEIVDYGIMGGELIGTLGTGISPVDPLNIYAPKKGVRINLANPSTAFNQGHLYSPGVVFVTNQAKYDAAYILTSLEFAQKLFAQKGKVSAIELKLKEGYSTNNVKKQIQNILGEEYVVQNRYEQQADVFRIMEIEKLVSYLFLTFILAIACFNIIGSLSMLILDKQEDVNTLRQLGASDRLITNIFILEGQLISFSGSILGIIFGVTLCLLQQHFGLLTLGGNGQFIVDAYPVSLHFADVCLIFATVIVITFITVYFPIRYLCKRIIN